ncbi:unnamed protein product [Brassica oleracea]
MALIFGIFCRNSAALRLQYQVLGAECWLDYTWIWELSVVEDLGKRRERECILMYLICSILLYTKLLIVDTNLLMFPFHIRYHYSHKTHMIIGERLHPSYSPNR